MKTPVKGVKENEGIGKYVQRNVINLPKLILIIGVFIYLTEFFKNDKDAHPSQE
jgi:hypothetical protein